MANRNNKTGKNSEINKSDVELLQNILSMWNEVSGNSKAYHSMTDHCHIEYNEGIELASKMEKILKGKEEDDQKICQNCKYFDPIDGKDSEYGDCVVETFVQKDFVSQTPINGVCYGHSNELYGMEINEFCKVGSEYGCIHFKKRN